MALDGDTAVIGAYLSDDGGTINHGAAYVFTSSGGVWTEQAKLLASDKGAEDWFGYSVALDGDTAVIGAFGADDNGTAEVGAAYVYTRSDGVWTEQAKLMASDKVEADGFGWSVGIDGDTAVIGTWGKRAAYVFTRSGAVWTEQAKLLASDRDGGGFFGWSVALDGDTAVIGAITESDGGTISNGAAYVFTRSGGAWAEQGKLLASDKDSHDFFGMSVALYGDTAIIGTSHKDDSGLNNNGAAYVFTRSGGIWTEQAKLLASDKDHNDQFGYSVALDGDTALICAPEDIDFAEDGGGAYIFTRTGGVWTEQVKLLASDKFIKDQVHYSAALDGDTALVGGGSNAAYVFALMPLAMDDGPYVLDEGRELVEDVNILDNDSNPGGDPLTPVVVDPPARASFFQVMPDGTVDYTHDGSETTSDSFTYRASDGVNESEIATVSLEITPVNDAPRVQLIGQSTISIDRGAAYTDPGATAEDSEDGDISDAIVVGGDVVDTNVDGTYLVTYNVTDSDGLAADEVSRTVIVTVDDPPVITLIGPATLTLQVADAYEEQGAMAQDPEDGDLTNAIVIDNPVDTSTPGTYTVTYTVGDSAGNQAQAERVVIVEPPPVDQPPTITLNGAATVRLTEGDSYSDAGATASDPEDGDLTVQIVVNNPVDTGTPGTYTVTFTVEDSGGNQAQAERTVIVEAAPPPPPPQTDRGGGGGGGAVAPIELLASVLTLLAIGRHRQRSACAPRAPVHIRLSKRL